MKQEDGSGSAVAMEHENNSKIETPGKTASMAPVEDGVTSVRTGESEPEIDDRGTDQSEASQLLKDIRDSAFDSSDEKLALALGRPTEEIEEWTRGGGTIDGDVLLKARALADARGVEIE
jgi:hypothetical protein